MSFQSSHYIVFSHSYAVSVHPIKEIPSPTRTLNAAQCYPALQANVIFFFFLPFFLGHGCCTKEQVRNFQISAVPVKDMQCLNHPMPYLPWAPFPWPNQTLFHPALSEPLFPWLSAVEARGEQFPWAAASRANLFLPHIRTAAEPVPTRESHTALSLGSCICSFLSLLFPLV